MDETFFAYLQRLETIAFFSGYPLVYTIIYFITGSGQTKTLVKGKIFSLLPFSYALVGTLYLGLQLKNLYMDRSGTGITYLVGWGLLSLIFWIPVIARRPVLSLLHSFVFFFFLLRDVFFQTHSNGNDRSVIANDMKLYTDSLLLNIAALAIVIMAHFLSARIRHYKKASHH